MKDLRIYAIDIGTLKTSKKRPVSNFGWASAPSEGLISLQGSDIHPLAENLASELSQARPIALGFEAPLFLRIRQDPGELTSARTVDQGKAWSAAAGLGSFGVASVQVPWLMRSIASQITSPIPCFLDWEAFQAAEQGLFIWEAFVSGDAKGKSHMEDAAIAVKAFQAALPNPTLNRPAEQGLIINLAGCALLWSGLSADQNLMHEPCLVIKA